MNLKYIKQLLLGLAIIGILLIPKFFCGSANSGGGANKPGPKPPVKVSVYGVHHENISNKIEVSGNLLANEQVKLTCETQGLITELNLEEGSIVQAGTLLVKLNDADLKAQFKKAQANKKLKEEIEKRNKTLLNKEAISIQDYDLSLTELNAANADIELLQAQIRKTEIRAPFTGQIGLRSVSKGAFITPGTLIATLQDVQQIKLEFSLPEKFISAVHKGNIVNFSVGGMDKIYQAKIYAIEPNIAEQTRTVLMRSYCLNKDQNLIPGLFAHVNISLEGSKSSLYIPTQALIPILKGQKVFILRGDSAVEQMVKTGYRNENKIEITEGLVEGDSVIVDGIMYMKNGSKVLLNRKK